MEEYTTVPEDLLGEITVVLGPPLGNGRDGEERVRAAIAEENAKGGKAKEVAARVQTLVRGWSRKEIYALMLNA